MAAKGSFTHALIHPVDVETVVNGEDRRIAFDRVTVRRVKGKDLRWIEKQGAALDSIELLQRLTGLSPAEADELDGEDVVAMSAVIEGFMPPGPTTGRRSSGS